MTAARPDGSEHSYRPELTNSSFWFWFLALGPGQNISKQYLSFNFCPNPRSPLHFGRFSSFLFAIAMEGRMADPRYPIGKFSFEGPPDDAQRKKLIDDIAQTPAALRSALQGLTPQQIETPYRDGGWTVRQVTHHVPESHMNAYIRFKLALTEDSPTIKPYMEDRWANTPDVTATPVEVSLALLDSLHDGWVR